MSQRLWIPCARPSRDSARLRKLYEDLVGETGDREADRSHMVARSEGNPLYLVELARLRRAPTGDDPLVPQTFARIVQRRTDTLTRCARGVLEVAAVAGSHVPLRMLEIATVRLLPDCRAGDAVSLLEEREFIRAPVPEPDDEVEFVHALGSIFRRRGTRHG